MEKTKQLLIGFKLISFGEVTAGCFGSLAYAAVQDWKFLI